jgi:hypothetical protein
MRSRVEIMQMYDLPEATQKVIKEALLEQLEEQIESGQLPELMEIEEVSFEQETIILELTGGMGKVAEVKMNQRTYQISHLELVEGEEEVSYQPITFCNRLEKRGWR